MAKKDQLISDAISKLDSKLDLKIDAISGRLDSIEKVMIKQESNIEYHVKRTDLAEKNLELLRTDLKPIQKHVDYMNGALKALGMLATVIAMIAGVLKIISLIHI